MYRYYCLYYSVLFKMAIFEIILHHYEHALAVRSKNYRGKVIKCCLPVF